MHTESKESQRAAYGMQRTGGQAQRTGAPYKRASHANWLRLALVLGLFLSFGAGHAQVAMRQMQAGDMPITLLYPTAAVAQTVERGPWTLQVAMNAPLLAVPSPEKRRLVVLSHGTAGSPSPDYDLALTLVRAGFVVAQPLHRADNYLDFSKAGPESWRTRPSDVIEIIDAVAKDTALATQVNTQRVGVHGMSAGGVTGLALAGAQWRMLDLVQHCARNLEDDIGFCLNGLGDKPVQQAMRKAQFMAAKALPEDRAPESMKVLEGGRGGSSSSAAADPRPDLRVAAVSLAVPLAAIFTAESLARIAIPVGLTTAGNDGVLAPRYHSERVLDYCKTCRRLSAHPGAGHFDWLSPWPADVAQTVAATQMRGGLPNPQFTPAERQKAFDAIAVFFAQTL